MNALVAIERADKAVSDLCHGRLRWEMRVPAEPDHDPDLIIGEALMRAHALLVAGDAMHATAEGHSEIRYLDANGEPGEATCLLCDNDWPCPTRQAADEWKRVTG